MNRLRERLKIYFIMGSQDCNRDPVDILQEAIKGGILAFQFREKGSGSLEGEAKLRLGKKLRDLCREHHVLFFVNDDIHLVEKLDADGIHIGQDDAPASEVRRLFPEKIIGLSVSNDDELNASLVSAVDYLGVGAMYTTMTKQDAKAAVGTEWMRELRDRLPDVPLVGIGGIDIGNARKVIEAGADGVSVISAIASASDPEAAVRGLKQMIMDE